MGAILSVAVQEHVVLETDLSQRPLSSPPPLLQHTLKSIDASILDAFNDEDWTDAIKGMASSHTFEDRTLMLCLWLPGRDGPDDVAMVHTERCHILLNKAMCCLRLKLHQECADACREVLPLQYSRGTAATSTASITDNTSLHAERYCRDACISITFIARR